MLPSLTSHPNLHLVPSRKGRAVKREERKVLEGRNVVTDDTRMGSDDLLQRDKNLDLGEDKPSEVEAIGIGSSIIVTA